MNLNHFFMYITSVTRIQFRPTTSLFEAKSSKLEYVCTILHGDLNIGLHFVFFEAAFMYTHFMGHLFVTFQRERRMVKPRRKQYSAAAVTLKRRNQKVTFINWSIITSSFFTWSFNSLP